MRKNKILIMGASNSILPSGLRAGLSQSNVDFDNLSIGGSIASSKIYTILKYKQRIKEADLVILECNLADVDRLYLMILVLKSVLEILVGYMKNYIKLMKKF
ncbi:hypothetical protein NYC80_001708 [Campylobacter jejuni]|nr:hypothetical protein [Campylobacter jejuni]EJQ4000829.1 hypothetical protein [Campylobacter jejuni]